MDSNRIEEKIWRIFDGVPFRQNNITIKVIAGKLLVEGWTNNILFENISKNHVQNELIGLKGSFYKLCNSYPDLINLTKLNQLKIEFHISYDTGKAGIGYVQKLMVLSIGIYNQQIVIGLYI